jgi:hypothetical protein
LGLHSFHSALGSRAAVHWHFCLCLAKILATDRHCCDASGQRDGPPCACFRRYLFRVAADPCNATWVDVRALPLIAVFAMLGCLTQLDDALSQPRKAVIFVGIASAAVLALANLIYLASHLQRLEQKITDYRAVIAVLPKDSWVFPVYTNITERPIKSTFHAASFALIDRQALTPYLFSRNLGDPMQYFSYRNKPYAPDEDWYTDVHSEPVDWQAIARDYDFVLVTKPFDLRRIPISTGPIFENSAAALFTTGRTTSISAQGTAH